MTVWLPYCVGSNSNNDINLCQKKSGCRNHMHTFFHTCIIVAYDLSCDLTNVTGT